MEVKLKAGDSLNIPEGCKAVIDNDKVFFQSENENISGYVPNRGDIVVCSYNVPNSFIRETVTAICKGYSKKDDRSLYACFVIYEHGGIIKINKSIHAVKEYSEYRSEIRLANEDEKQILFEKMTEQGMRWNEEKKNVERIRWRAKKDRKYYFLTGLGDPKEAYEHGTRSDYDRWIMGNYLRTEEQVEEAARRVKETLRKYHEEIACGLL